MLIFTAESAELAEWFGDETLGQWRFEANGQKTKLATDPQGHFF